MSAAPRASSSPSPSSSAEAFAIGGATSRIAGAAPCSSAAVEQVTDPRRSRSGRRPPPSNGSERLDAAEPRHSCPTRWDPRPLRSDRRSPHAVQPGPSALRRDPVGGVVERFGSTSVTGAHIGTLRDERLGELSLICGGSDVQDEINAGARQRRSAPSDHCVPGPVSVQRGALSHRDSQLRGLLGCCRCPPPRRCRGGPRRPRSAAPRSCSCRQPRAS
jgi:hypothetical protein